MKRRHHPYICSLIVLLPIGLLLCLCAVAANVQAAKLEQQTASFEVSRNVISFAGEQGGPNPRQQWFGVVNTGDEPIHWSVSALGNASWLEVIPTSGLDDGAVRVSVDTSGLTGTLLPWTFTETLVVTAQETSAIEIITVTLLVSSDIAPLYSEDFQAYAPGTNPVDWLDTDANNSLEEDDSLFRVFALGGNRAFGTSSTLDNIHSHYVGADSETFSSYEYSGRMRMMASNSGIGVTFFSQYPHRDAYYRLRRYGSSSFQIDPHGTSISGGTTDTGVFPGIGVWYRFRIRAEDMGTQTEIKAKVWAEGTPEPSGWQIDCYDASPTRLAAGTFGVWSSTSGNKYWDDLEVNALPPEPDESPPSTYGHDPVPSSANVAPSSNIVVHVVDQSAGVDSATLAMTVEGLPVIPTVTGNLFDYTLTYDPPVDFTEGEEVMVTVDACDLAASPNCMDTEVYSFTVWTLPVLDLWYGSQQTFGHIGNPQQWVNVLGNVSDPDGITSLTYSLNGGPESSLSIGPDDRRLANEGDFNVEIAYTGLNAGLNQIVFTATDGLSTQKVETMTIEYVSGNVWPRPYTIDWSSVTAITDVVQIVDGQWTLGTDGIRPLAPDYDRLVAIGDITWDDYEVTVPITIYAIDPAGFNPISVAPGLGLVVRWQGHTDSPVVCPQPHCGWYPQGAAGWYEWQSGGGNRLSLSGNQGELIGEDTSRTLNLYVGYYFKMHVETIAGQGGLYAFKVWPTNQPEPSEWDFFGQEELADPQNGSVLLEAHHVDARFGDVTVSAGPFSDTIPPVISNIQVLRRETSATITWNTNEPATSRVDYGPSPAYENGSVTDSTLVTQHAITLTGLTPETLYHYQVTSVDAEANSASSEDMTFETTSSESIIASDDFNACSLNTELWTFTDPLGDATLIMEGTHTENAWVSIAVPAGVSHDVWDAGIQTPRIMQADNDKDFEVEIKFESGLNGDHQVQGILVQQDGDNLLRLDFHSYGPDTRIFAASITNGTPSVRISSLITDTGVAPLYMRVKREGDQWTQSFSYDGEYWTTAGSFTHVLTVTAVGAFVGNSGDNPAHTGSIDYFFNTASPIVPEDGDRNTLTVSVVGSGAVAKEPDLSTYVCNQAVTLTATADPGWTFGSWSGDLLGSTNPVTMVMTESQVVTATFTQNAYTLTVNAVGNGTVAVDPDQPSYVYNDVVTLTANPAPGWSFAGWNGGLSGTVNPATLTITGNQVVTATFTQDAYTLAVNVAGAGTVAVQPVQSFYVYNDVVTLTATAAQGWSFSGWSGDLEGSTNPTALTMTGSKIVTATFTNDPPILDPIGDQVVVSGVTLSFTVSASDPEGITPTLSVENLPGGASFTDHENGTADLSWKPTLTDTGTYTVTFIASDGVLTASETIHIIVNAPQPQPNYRIFLPFITHGQQTSLAATSIRLFTRDATRTVALAASTSATLLNRLGARRLTWFRRELIDTQPIGPAIAQKR